MSYHGSVSPPPTPSRRQYQERAPVPCPIDGVMLKVVPACAGSYVPGFTCQITPWLELYVPRFTCPCRACCGRNGTQRQAGCRRRDLSARCAARGRGCPTAVSRQRAITACGSRPPFDLDAGQRNTGSGVGTAALPTTPPTNATVVPQRTGTLRVTSPSIPHATS